MLVLILVLVLEPVLVLVLVLVLMLVQRKVKNLTKCSVALSTGGKYKLSVAKLEKDIVNNCLCSCHSYISPLILHCPLSELTTKNITINTMKIPARVAVNVCVTKILGGENMELNQKYGTRMKIWQPPKIMELIWKYGNQSKLWNSYKNVEIIRECFGVMYECFNLNKSRLCFVIYILFMVHCPRTQI